VILALHGYWQACPEIVRGGNYLPIPAPENRDKLFQPFLEAVWFGLLGELLELTFE